ncbi:TPA: cylE protein, partial [Streptococcus agalactiae]
FEDRQFHYYLPNEDKMISYSPPGKASNQMQFRPLCLIDTDSLSFPLTYHFRISQASSEEALINLKKQPIWDSNYQASATDLLKHISNLTLEEEKDYGIKRMIANRKHYPSHKLVLAYNQIVLPKNEIPRDSELYSISFDYRIRGKFVQIRQGEHVKYDNKSYVLENSQQLVLYVASDDKYILISAKNGIFYSYKENNHLKIRCMFKRNSPYATNVSITEYRKCEEK